MRAVFFGTPDWSVPALETVANSRHELIAVVCQPDRPRGRSRRAVPCPVKARALELGIARLLQPESLRPAATRTELLELDADVFVVVAYGRILPGRLLDAPSWGAVNLHFSLLPKFRGASPVQHALLAGEKVTGVTTMRMERGLDSGPLLLQRETAVEEGETTVELGPRLARIGAELLLETLDRLEEGRIDPRPQDESKVCWAPPLERNAGRISWTESATAIERKVRAFALWPRVRASGPKGPLLLLRARAGGGAEGAAPGLVGKQIGECALVACGDGRWLEIELIQPAGKRAMSGAAAMAGHYLVSGEQLGECPP